MSRIGIASLKQLFHSKSGSRSLIVVLIFLIFGIGVSILGIRAQVAEQPVMPVTGEIKSDADIAPLVFKAAYFSLDRELNNSVIGWVPNDLMISPTSWFDNKKNLQRGIIFATRGVINVYTTHFARSGSGEEINKHLLKAQTSSFPYAEDVWMFASSESRYKEGIQSINSYLEDVENGKAVFNVKTDDLYTLIDTLESLIEMPQSRLKTGVDSHFEADDAIYFAKGVCLVVRDVLNTVTLAYPELMNRGGEQNVAVALETLDTIASFNPLYVFAGGNKNGDSMLPNQVQALASKLDITANRLRDIKLALDK
ncbi:DUF2333 family protein [Halodesulfovibrio aestuarii]|uniref:DUF2333 family protein n=1 Tax=Halodesulfovibrio aestuarii TaxID=126333 RepID=UPI003D3396AA